MVAIYITYVLNAGRIMMTKEIMKLNQEKYDRLIKKLNSSKSQIYLSRIERILIEFALEHYTDDTNYFDDE